MKTVTRSFLLLRGARCPRAISAALLAATLSLLPSVRGAEASKVAGAAADAPKGAVVIPKSLFSNAEAGAKDPFFPGRVRGSVAVSTNTVSKPLHTELYLRGITGTGERRIALINNQTFAVGDEGEVRLGGAKVRVRLVEVRDKSVLVLIAGEDKPRELVLQDRVLPLEQN